MSVRLDEVANILQFDMIVACFGIFLEKKKIRVGKLRYQFCGTKETRSHVR